MSASAAILASCQDVNSRDKLGLRISAIFVVLVTSFVGTLAPILLRNRKWCPLAFFEYVVVFEVAHEPSQRCGYHLLTSDYVSLCDRFAKYFGSGVIIATAFIQLVTRSHFYVVYI
jgi:hypothetical protein